MEIETGVPSASYCLSEAFLGGQKFQIDADRYVELNEAITTVVSAMEIEELFQIFAESFLRFEKDLLDVSFEYTYISGPAELEKLFSKIRNRFNVNILTVLTSYRSYDDHFKRILKSSSHLSEAKEFNEKTRSTNFDTHLSYRVCAQLRNYAQHRALPLGGFTIGPNTNMARDATGIVRKLGSGFNVSPWLNVMKFKGSSQVKRSLKKDLDCLGYEKIDMKWLVRSFAAAMYERHAELRAFLKPEIEAAGSKIVAGYDLASAEKKSEAKFLELDGDGQKRPMRNDLAAKVLREFETQVSLKNAAQNYVTSQIKPDVASYSGPDDLQPRS